MTRKAKKYIIRKVDKQGEDTTVNAAAFDRLLKKLIASEPLPNKELTGKKKRRPALHKQGGSG